MLFLADVDAMLLFITFQFGVIFWFWQMHLSRARCQGQD